MLSDHPTNPLTEVASRKLPSSTNAIIATIDNPLILTLVIDDPEISLELKKYGQGSTRDAFALSALRIGILSLRQAQGQIDAETIRNEGVHLMSELT